MAGNIAIGIQDFSTIIQGNYFYIDKTPFIKEWWDCGDSATLITRPRRFGKTLTMSMVEQFFSIDYAGFHFPKCKHAPYIILKVESCAGRTSHFFKEC